MKTGADHDDPLNVTSSPAVSRATQNDVFVHETASRYWSLSMENGTDQDEPLNSSTLLFPSTPIQKIGVAQDTPSTPSPDVKACVQVVPSNAKELPSTLVAKQKDALKQEMDTRALF